MCACGATASASQTRTRRRRAHASAVIAHLVQGKAATRRSFDLPLSLPSMASSGLKRLLLHPGGGAVSDATRDRSASAEMAVPGKPFFILEVIGDSSLEQ